MSARNIGEGGRRVREWWGGARERENEWGRQEAGAVGVATVTRVEVCVEAVEAVQRAVVRAWHGGLPSSLRKEVWATVLW